MAHNLAYYGAGQRAYMGRRSAWHELGTVTGTYFSWGDICSNGMMAFTVENYGGATAPMVAHGWWRMWVTEIIRDQDS